MWAMLPAHLPADPLLLPTSTEKQIDISPSVHRVELNHAGRVLCTAEDRSVSVWDLRSGGSIGHFSHRAMPFYGSPVITGVAIATDSKTVISAGVDGAIQIWSVVDERVIRIIREPWLRQGDGREPRIRKDRPFVPLVSLSVSIDGRLLAAGTNDGTAHVWRADTGRYFGQFGTQRSARRLFVLSEMLSPQDDHEATARELAKTNEDGKGMVALRSAELWTLDDNQEQQVYCLGFNSNASMLACLISGTLTIYDVATRSKSLAITDCSAASVSADGRRLVYLPKDSQQVHVHGFAQDELRQSPRTTRAGNSLVGVRLLPDSNYVVVERASGIIELVDVATGKIERRFGIIDGNYRIIETWSVAGNGSRIVCHWRGNGTEVWDVIKPK
jgi:WD40 repeat protein